MPSLIGKTQITFNRKKLLLEGECESSRGYYDICLADEENTDPIVPDDPNWGRFRPSVELIHDSCQFGRMMEERINKEPCVWGGEGKKGEGTGEKRLSRVDEYDA